MNSINNKYAKLLGQIYFAGETVHPRGMKVLELRNIVFTLEDCHDNVITLPRVATNLNYAKIELEWYLDGTNKIDFHPLIQKVWAKYSDDGITVNSNYGNRIFGKHEDFLNQWDWVIAELQKDPDSRRAVINLNYPGDKDEDLYYGPTKDFVCTMYIQAFIRNGKLEWTVAIRSNDVYYGFRNDIYCFTSLQQMMAAELGIPAGSYTHFAGSMHLYEKDFNKVEALIADGTILPPDEVISVEYSLAALRRVLDHKFYDKEGNPRT